MKVNTNNIDNNFEKSLKYPFNSEKNFDVR